MNTYWVAVYAVTAGLAIVQSLLVLLQTWEHRRFARNRLDQLYRYRPSGRAMVYVPCKGVDVGQEENLRRLLDQDYGDYVVTFIVESTSDPAYGLIRGLMAEHPRVQTHVVVAGLADGSGQKIHNLRAATAEIPSDVEYVAFADSDARPRRQWLRALVSHLGNPKVGVSSGYRWFVPVEPTFAAHLIYSINCSVAVLFRSRDPNLIWGGSWAMRREVFDSLGIHRELEGMLTEDLVVARVARRNRLRVEYEPGCMVASPLDGDFPKLFGFLRRQYMLGRFYVPGWWGFGFLTTLYANLVLLANLGLCAWGLAARSPWAWVPAGVCAVLYGLHVVRGLVRQSLVSVYCPALRGALRRAARFDVWAGPLVSMLSTAGLVSSALGRQVTWRGITYRVLRGGQTRIVRRDADAPGEHDEGRGPEPNRPADVSAPAARWSLRKAG